MTFGRQSRLPRQDTRARRNADRMRMAGIVGDGLTVNNLGQMSVNLSAIPGLEFVDGALQTKVAAPIILNASGIGLSFGTGLQNDTGVLKTKDSEIVHDNLSGFVGNEHIDHSLVSISPGTGMTGGGTLAATRTLGIDRTVTDTWYAAAGGAPTPHTMASHTDDDTYNIATTGSILIGGTAIFNSGYADVDFVIRKNTTGLAYVYDGGADTHSFSGTVNFGTCVNAGVDTDKFLVLDAAGNMDFRTGAEVLSDIGAGAGSVIAVTGTAPIASSGGATPAISLTFGTGLQNDTGTLKTKDSEIVHDNLSGFVANEHIDWTDATSHFATTNYVDARGGYGFRLMNGVTRAWQVYSDYSTKTSMFVDNNLPFELKVGAGAATVACVVSAAGAWDFQGNAITTTGTVTGGTLVGNMDFGSSSTYKTLQLRRDTAANWASNNPLLAAGEVGLETDTGQMKAGNGSANWNSLPYLVDRGMANFAWQHRVISTLNTPPMGPAAGARYLVGDTPTDDFVGHEDDVATWLGSGYSFYTPSTGDMFWHTTDGKYYYWDSAAWTEWSGGGGGSVTSVTGTAPIVSSGGTDPAISLTIGTGLRNDGGTLKTDDAAIVKFINRGDPSAEDFDLTDITTDGAWHDLDLSAIVPAGATAVFLRFTATASSAGKYVWFRKNGNSYHVNSLTVQTYAAGVASQMTGFVFCDTDRVIEYQTSNTADFIFMYIIVQGWMI